MNDSTDDRTPQPHVTIHGDVWAKVPEALIYSELSANAVRIYAAFMRHGSDPTNCYPSYARLAELCHMGQTTVRRAVAELVEAGWIEIEHRYDADGRQTSNGYHIHLDPDSTGGVSTGGQGEVSARGQGTCPPVDTKREPLNESQLKEKQVPAKKATKRSGISTRARLDRAENDALDGNEGSDVDGWDNDWLADTTPIRAETPTAPLDDTGPSGAPLITLAEFLALDR